jgi:hypothetical protein
MMLFDDADRRIGCSVLIKPKVDSHPAGFDGSHSSIVIPKKVCLGSEVLGLESMPHTVHPGCCQDLHATSRCMSFVADLGLL